MTISKVAPWPLVLRARTEPWWASAMACTMGRPRPNPPASRLRYGSARVKRPKMWSRSSGGMPQPESATAMTALLPSRRTLTSMRSPGSVCATAFSSSASSATTRRSASPDTVASAASPSRQCRGTCPQRSSASRIRESVATGATCRKPGVPAEASSSSRFVRRRSRASSPVTTRASAATPWSATVCSISSAWPSATVIGVPSSCEASTRNWRCCSSRRRFSWETRCNSSMAVSRSWVAASRRRPCQTMTRNISAISGTSAR